MEFSSQTDIVKNKQQKICGDVFNNYYWGTSLMLPKLGVAEVGRAISGEGCSN